MSAAQRPQSRSPYVSIDRADWSDLAGSSSLPLTEEELRNIRGLGDLLDLQEVSEVYLPVSELLSIYVKQAQLLHGNTVEFLVSGLPERRLSSPWQAR